MMYNNDTGDIFLIDEILLKKCNSYSLFSSGN